MSTIGEEGRCRPLFIVFEGIDGSGKSSLARMTAEVLEQRGGSVTFLSEPTKGLIGLRIREMLSSPVAPDPDVIMELFVDDRDEDVRNNIVPALSERRTVVMDRYYHSNAAYQGASGMSFRRILKINADRGFPKPDIVYLLDCDPEVSLARVAKRNESAGSTAEAFERSDFLSVVRGLYLEMKDDSFCVLDASKDLSVNLERVLSEIDARCSRADQIK